MALLALVTFIVVILGGSEDEEKCAPEGGGGGVPRAAGGLAEPVQDSLNSVSSPYLDPSRSGHNGTDFAKPDGDPIYALADGVVAEAGPASGFGQWIVIDHNLDGQEFSTVYGHMWEDGVLVSAGDEVTAGDQIGEVGSNGQSTGAHLHFEVWEPSRLRGGNHVDPMPYIEQAASGEPVDGAQPEPETETSGPRDTSGGGEEMPPSDKIQNEDKLQVDSVRVARAVAQRFPQVETIGGWRANDPYPDHPSGRAVDVMIPNYNSDEGRQLGDDITAYLHGNRDHFNIDYMIWRQEYIPAEGQPNTMEDRGSDVQNHFDHVHITVDGGGMPAPGQQYGPAPEGGSSAPGAAGDDLPEDCLPGPGVDAELNDAEIPEELRKWITLGGRVCEEVSSPLLAGLLYHESAGFQADAVSSAGAQGYGQFMPSTWATAGAEVDNNGEVTGPPGSGSPSDPADATMAAARYLCEVAAGQRDGIESGELEGDPTELMLAGYNAGPGAVQQYGGVPPYAETQKYVKIVPQEAEKFTDA